MSYKRLFIFVEGDDDERFFQRIIKPKLEEKYDEVKLIKYSRMKSEKVFNLLKSVKAMGAEYIYVADINQAPCITARIQQIQGKFFILDIKRIIVVIKEIESWYLAGLDTSTLQKFEISPFNTTENITKEQFNNLIPKNFDSRIDFMLEILEHFSVEIAKGKNSSFRYFLEKYNCKNF